MKPIYKIDVTDSEDLVVDFNSIVDRPAHMKRMIHFNTARRYDFNEEKRVVTGVMISAGTPIERFDTSIGSYFVIFDAKTIEVLKRRFFKNGFNKNLNLNHDPKKVVTGATLIDSYTIYENNPNYPKVPEALADQKLMDGTWIASYYIEDDNLWNDVKAGKFGGFSVELWSNQIEVEVKRKFKQMKKKSIWEMITGKADDQKTFAEITTIDGVVLTYEGDLAEGTQLFMEVDGEQVPAPEGEHQVDVDGVVKVVTLDGSGVVTAITELMEDQEDDMREEVAEVMKKLVADTNERFTKLEQENADLKAELETMKKGGKFVQEPKKTGKETPKLTVSEILKRK